MPIKRSSLSRQPRVTGKACIDLIVTDLAVFSVKRGQGLTLLEHANDCSVDMIHAKTAAHFDVSPKLKPISV